MLLLAASHAAESDTGRITQGVYLYSAPVNGEADGITTGPDTAPVSFSAGRLSDGDLTRSVFWPGKQGAPRTIRVVFDLQADLPVSNIVLHTRRPNKHHRTDSVAVDVRASSDTAYRVALFAREGIKAPWETIEIPVDPKTTPIRYVRVTFTRRHSFVNTPLSEVAIYATPPSPTAAATSPSDHLAAEFSLDAMLVDRFGQYLYEDWVGKITSADDLKHDLNVEKQRPSTTAVEPIPSPPDTQSFEATGFFRLQKIDNRWWFITPDGKPWLMNGVCVTAPEEGGYSTSLKRKDGTHRGVFTELPDRTTHRDAYTHERDDDRVNFLIANLRDKYSPETGGQWRSAWTTQMQVRLQDWGINANAKWTRAPALGLPYITVLRPAAQARRIKYAIDPWDPDFASHVEAGIASQLTTIRDDPLIIGHTFESEKGWDFDVFTEMMKLDHRSPAKTAFIERFLERYASVPETLCRLLALPANTSPDELTREALLKRQLSVSEALHDEARAFIAESGRHYYATAIPIILRHDPNHLILGSSLTPGWHSSYEWETAAVGHVDALSFDYYVSNPDWIAPYLKYDLPILLLEYSFVVNGRGLPGFHTTVATQRDRGLYYRSFIEQLAALPQFVGAGWFLLYDQPVTGRNIGGGGECHNFGLINQQDQPYEEMLNEVRKTSRRLHAVHAGVIPPFINE